MRVLLAAALHAVAAEVVDRLRRETEMSHHRDARGSEARDEVDDRGVMWAFVLMVFLVSAFQGSLAVAVTFGAVAFGIWVVCAHDAYREAAGERNAVLLRGKTFMYLMLALLMLLFVLLIVSFFRARGGL